MTTMHPEAEEKPGRKSVSQSPLLSVLPTYHCVLLLLLYYEVQLPPNALCRLSKTGFRLKV
jgi:hypothetical protein